MVNTGDTGATRYAEPTVAVRAATVPVAGTGPVHATTLPRQFTSFVGREREIREIGRLLATRALVTLTGTGGVGKTRLALQAAAGVIDAYPDGVWFVDLAPLADPALVASTTLTALGVRGAPAEPAQTTLTTFLKQRQTLLLLDNCEHVIETCARLVAAVLQQCPGARILATSRELLGVTGETAWRVPSLALPEPDGDGAQPHTAQSLDQYEAVRLFLDRALAVEPAFQVTNQNAPALAQICHRLDGIPLAIELAAARVRVLSVEQIAARLGDRFRLLTGGGRTALRRQQTLQALVDWSHDLLSDSERALFRRLAVFAGGFTLEAAEAVCGVGTPHGGEESDVGVRRTRAGVGELVESYEVLDLVTSLVDKSLVVAGTNSASGSDVRYRLLETMRQYADDKLVQASEDATLRDRHLDWCLALARGADVAERSRDMAQFQAARLRFNAETDNVRVALTWGASTPEGAALALDILACTSYTPRPAQAEIVRWLDTLLDAAPARTKVRVRALLRLDHMRRTHHDFAGARVAVEEARAIAGEIGDDDLATQAAARSALVAANLGEYVNAVAELERCVAVARVRDLWTWVEEFTRSLGVISIAIGDFSRARAALAVSRDIQLQHGSSYTSRPRLFLTVVDRLTGDLRGARTALEALCAEVGAWDSEKSQFDRFVFHEPARCALANIARDEGRFDDARRLLWQSLDDLRRSGEVGPLSDPTCMAGMLAIAAGDAERGVTLLAACTPASGLIGTIHVPEVRLEAPTYLDQARATLGDAAYDAAWERGRRLTLQEAVELALTEPATPPAPRHPAPGGLSPRESQVAALVARGLTNREIAADLVITEHTAMRHVENILSKLGLRSRTQVAAWVVGQVGAGGVARGTPTG